jgi:4-hydroxymandelate oxidase
MYGHKPTRRQLLGGVGALVAGSMTGSALSQAQTNPPRGAGSSDPEQVRLAPRAELVNSLEYETQAKLKLEASTYALIAGGDRAAFDRMTLRPRMLSPVLDMDLGVTLFGETHFTPILVGPMADQKRFHPDGELATVIGASAGKAVVMVSSHSSVPLETLAAQTKTSLWYQVFPNEPAARTQIQRAVTAGCKAICVTVGVVPAPPGVRAVATAAAIDGTAFSALRRGVTVPVLVKGITTPDAAQLALRNGADGIVVSSYGLVSSRKQAPILSLPDIVDSVAGKVPVLVDGSFRRGTDILKALAFGAQGVLLGRPMMWGLAAYGADGVQGVIEMLQTELARYMGMCGRSNLKALDRAMVKVHA